jgi:hypothetical protein
VPGASPQRTGRPQLEALRRLVITKDLSDRPYRPDEPALLPITEIGKRIADLIGPASVEHSVSLAATPGEYG